MLWNMSCLVPVPNTPHPSGYRRMTYHHKNPLETLVRCFKVMSAYGQTTPQSPYFAISPDWELRRASYTLFYNIYTDLDKLLFLTSPVHSALFVQLLNEKLTAMSVDAPLVTWTVKRSVITRLL